LEVDLLVLVDDASWDGKLRVHAAFDDSALDLELAAVNFSVHVKTPEWLAQRKAIRSFFIAEIDRDKVVLVGDGRVRVRPSSWRRPGGDCRRPLESWTTTRLPL